MFTSQALTIRHSEMKDAPDLIALDELVWNERTAPASLSWKSRGEFLRSSPPGSQLVAIEQGVLCGYVGFRPPTLLASNRHVLEINIAVHPYYHRKGIGTALMNSMKNIAVAEGIRKLSLRVLSCNSEALMFYEKCGFEIEGRLHEEFYIAGQFVDDVLMSYFLK